MKVFYFSPYFYGKKSPKKAYRNEQYFFDTAPTFYNTKMIFVSVIWA